MTSTGLLGLVLVAFWVFLILAIWDL